MWKMQNCKSTLSQTSLGNIYHIWLQRNTRTLFVAELVFLFQDLGVYVWSVVVFEFRDLVFWSMFQQKYFFHTKEKEKKKKKAEKGFEETYCWTAKPRR